MKGTAILYREDQTVTVVENLDHEVLEKMKEQTGRKHCNCQMGNKIIDYGTVRPVLWHDDEVDWDYGY